MTNNQRRAIRLAEEIARVSAAAEPALPDSDWHLLLLAAGVNHVCARSHAVAKRVLDQSRQHAGYFAPAVRSLADEGRNSAGSRRPADEPSREGRARTPMHFLPGAGREVAVAAGRAGVAPGRPSFAEAAGR